MYFLSTKSDPWSISNYVNTENVTLPRRFKIPKNDENKTAMKENGAQYYMYNHNTIQYYQTCLTMLSKFLKHNFMLISHYTQQHYTRTSQKNNKFKSDA